jgi:C_GCAxxG_C_C family probable redox protein
MNETQSILNLSNEVVDFLNKGYRCSEAVLKVYGKSFGLEEELAVKMGCALGGGLGGSGDTCGAIVGSILIIGLKFGRINNIDSNTKSQIDEMVREYIFNFKKIHKSINCSNMIGFDRSSESGRKQAIESGVIKKLCPRYVKDAAILLEQILNK